MFNKSDNINLDEICDKKSMFVHVLSYTPINVYKSTYLKLTSKKLSNNQCNLMTTGYLPKVCAPICLSYHITILLDNILWGNKN